MIVRRLTAERIDDMLNIEPREAIAMPERDVCIALAEQPSWIAYDEDVIAAFGAIPLNDGHFRCWAFLDKEASNRALYKLLKWMTRLLRRATYRRLDVTVQEDFPDGLVWLGRLGFEVEGLMRQYDLAGNNHYLLSRVNHVG